MSKEQKFTGIILKKQPFNEADEIITFFSKEAGKIRGIAKSVKLSKSKLQAKLQSLFVVEFSLAGKNLPKIIAAEPLEVFSNLRENYDSTIKAIYASELVMKFTADEQPNEPLFDLLRSFYGQLDVNKDGLDANKYFAKFKIDFLEVLGFGLTPELLENEFRRAGLNLLNDAKEAFVKLRLNENLVNESAINNLNQQLASFIEHTLERKIKSGSFIS